MTAAGLVCWTLLTLASPQSPPNPQQQPPPATGLIVGRVVDGGTGRPVAGAIVSMDGGGGGPVTPGSPARQPRAMTNANGQFVFRKLTKGSYQLSATRAGYVTGFFGSRRPGEGLSAPLQLAEGERVSDVVIPMWQHATISGTVTDEAGEPLINVMVRAFRRRVVGGRRRLLDGPQVTTDDRGVYRMRALVPGEYLVAFVWREIAVPTSVSETMRSPTGNDPKAQEIMRERMSIGSSGLVGTSSAVQVGGSVRDLYPAAPVPPAVADESNIYIYQTQFYPGVPSATRATAITLASGQQRDGVDFSLRPVKTVKVSGTLIGPEGPVPNTGVRLVSATEDTMTDLESSVTMTGEAGDFTLLGVPPGQYTLKVLRVPRPQMPAATTTSMTQIQMGSMMVMTSSSGPANPSPAPPAVTDDPTMFAEASISVGNRDVTDVLVTLQRGARVTGRFEFDGTRERPAASALVRVPISLERQGPVAAPTLFGNTIPPGRADETGVFKTYGVPAGKYVVRVIGAPPGWTLKSVMAEGRDVSEVPLDLRTTDVANVVVTFTDRPTKLSGVARTSTGNGDPDAVLVVFPTDPGAVSEYNPRRVRGTHAGRDGSYTFTGLPAGDYYVAAIHEDTTGDWRDPRVLEDLARGASQVRLADGDTRVQDVKTVKGGSQ
jgi:protocatechuate 3,4-dioxygenase beta subunit